jgi:hypothetical protein
MIELLALAWQNIRQWRLERLAARDDQYVGEELMARLRGLREEQR